MSDDDRLELRGLKLDWSDGRTERLLSGIQSHLAFRKRASRVAGACAAVISVAAIVLVLVRWQSGAQTSAPAVASSSGATSPGATALRDGSRMWVGGSGSEARVLEESPARVRIELVRGSARYEVLPNPERAFEVQAGTVTVTVVGTEFSVERRGSSAWVVVTHGKVRVSWGDGAQQRAFVTAGQSGLFPPSEALPDAGQAEDVPPAARGQQASQIYRSHVARRDYPGAYAVLSRNPSLAGDTVEELLVAADVARLSNHPAEAVPYLQRILREHARDERAPMAAFTLGRTLSGLGRTQEAMNVFGRVRSAWPRSPLGEDALVRQAEAAAKLGDSATLTRLAEQYDRQYPNGRRRVEVRRYARLE